MKGRFSGTGLDNERLSVSSGQLTNCGRQSAALGVWDSNTHGFLTTLATSDSFVQTFDTNKATQVWRFEVMGGSFPFERVSMETVTTSSLDDGGCPMKLNAVVDGGLYPVLGGAFVITRGKLAGKAVEGFVAP